MRVMLGVGWTVAALALPRRPVALQEAKQLADRQAGAPCPVGRYRCASASVLVRSVESADSVGVVWMATA